MTKHRHRPLRAFGAVYDVRASGSERLLLVTRRDRIDNGTMLAVRDVEDVAARQRAIPLYVKFTGKAKVDLGEAGIAAHPGQLGVKFQIDRIVLADLAGLGQPVHPVDQGAQRGDAFVGDVFGNPHHHACENVGARLGDVTRFLFTELAHEKAAIGNHLNQPQGCQGAAGLPDGAAADLQLLRQRVLVDPFVRREFSLDDHPLDLVIVIGGYNSSNTCNLARICAERRPTYHIAEPDCLLSPDQIRHRPVGMKSEVTTEGWLPKAGPVAIGLTSGASTPDNLVGVIVTRLAEVANAAHLGP